MTASLRPLFSPTLLVDTRRRPYKGPIRPGMVFAWEPDYPQRDLVVVARVVACDGEEPFIYTYSLYDPVEDQVESAAKTYNKEGRFREAVVATLLNNMPIDPRQCLVPDPLGLLKLELPKDRAKFKGAMLGAPLPCPGVGPCTYPDCSHFLD